MTERKQMSKFDIRHNFPALAEKLRFGTAEFLDKELISLFGGSEEKLDSTGEQKITDALILIQIQLEKNTEWLLIHWEQQSRKRNLFQVSETCLSGCNVYRSC